MNNNCEFNLKLVNDGIQQDNIAIGVTLDRIEVTSKPGGQCRGVAYSKDGMFFAWSDGHGKLKIILCSRDCHNEMIKEIIVRPEHCSVDVADIAAWFHVIKVGETIEAIKFSNDKYSCSEYQFQSHLIATGLTKGSIKIWHPVNGKIFYNLADHSMRVNGLTFAPIGVSILLSSSNDKTMKVWDLDDNGNMTLTLKGHSFPILDCAFNPTDAKMVCSVGKGRQAFIWQLQNTRKYEKVHQLRGHNNDVVSCDFSIDGALLATASYDTFVFVWDPYLGIPMIKLGHLNPEPCSIYAGGSNGCWLRSVAFSSNNTHIATICEDDRVRIWSLFDDDDIISCTLPSPGNKCVFSPNGSRLAIGNENGTVSIIHNLGVKLPSLCHLSRMAVRRTNSSFAVQSSALPPHIQSFLLYNF